MTEIKDTKEIFEQEPGDRPATPYFLVYVKDESKEDLVDSVCRVVIEPPPVEHQDIVMEDYSQAQESQPNGTTYRPITSSMDYGIAASYNSQGVPENSAWNQSSNEAQMLSSW